MTDDLHREIRRVCSEVDQVGAECDAFLLRRQQNPTDNHDRVVRKILHSDSREQLQQAQQTDEGWNNWFIQSFENQYRANIDHDLDMLFEDVEKEVLRVNDELAQRVKAANDLMRARISQCEESIGALRAELTLLQALRKGDVLKLPERPKVKSRNG